MKITSWNINGLRAGLNKGAWKWVKTEQPDVLCFQEIKARPDQLTQEQHLLLDGYQPYWNPAQRPGYSGVASFSKQAPLSVDYGLGEDRFDVEGRLLRLHYPGFYLYNIYFPNGQHDLGRLPYKLDFYDSLLRSCDQMHAQEEALILCGDFNTSHQEIDLRHPKANSKITGFLPEERVWIDYYLAHGFVDVYRELYPQRVQYTWWTYRMGARERNVGWRLDFFLISRSLMARVKDAIIHDEVTGSDHCPVTLVID